VVKLISYSECQDFVLNLIEVSVEDSYIYVLMRLTPKEVIKNKGKFMTDTNPKKLMGVLVNELLQYSDRTGEIYYVEGFKKRIDSSGIER
jgi:hypothetical protein